MCLCVCVRAGMPACVCTYVQIYIRLRACVCVCVDGGDCVHGIYEYDHFMAAYLWLCLVGELSGRLFVGF